MNTNVTDLEKEVMARIMTSKYTQGRAYTCGEDTMTWDFDADRDGDKAYRKAINSLTKKGLVVMRRNRTTGLTDEGLQVYQGMQPIDRRTLVLETARKELDAALEGLTTTEIRNLLQRRITETY